MKEEKKKSNNIRFGPLVLKCGLFLTFLIGFILNIAQFSIYFDFSHKIGEEIIMLVAGTYVVYFYFLSTINILTLAGYLIDYIGDKIDEKSS